MLIEIKSTELKWKWRISDRCKFSLTMETEKWKIKILKWFRNILGNVIHMIHHELTPKSYVFFYLCLIHSSLAEFLYIHRYFSFLLFFFTFSFSDLLILFRFQKWQRWIWIYLSYHDVTVAVLNTQASRLIDVIMPIDEPPNCP